MRNPVVDFEVDAAPEQVLHVVTAVDEYPSWHPEVRRRSGRIAWLLPLRTGHRVPAQVAAAVSPSAEAQHVLVTLRAQGRRLARVRFDLAPVGFGRTAVRAVFEPRPLLRALGDTRELGDGWGRLTIAMQQRGRWLPEAPDTGWEPARELAARLVPAPSTHLAAVR